MPRATRRLPGESGRRRATLGAEASRRGAAAVIWRWTRAVAGALAAGTLAAGTLLAAAWSCGSPPRPAASDSTRAAPPSSDTRFDTVARTVVPSAERAPRDTAGETLLRAAPTRTPLVDSMAQRLVFVPRGQDWLLAASRGGRLVVDLGRVDVDLRKDSLRFAAMRRAATALSPFPVGTRLRLRGAWGADDATIAGFDAWNGRIVATLETAPRVDSLARLDDRLVASARRQASPSSAGEACRADADAELVARLRALAREAEDSLRASDDQPIYARLRKAIKARRSVVTGCFGDARGVAITTLYAGDYEWVRERVLLVGASGVTRATVRDLRFRAHEALQALDADGDGVDDLAARAWTPRGGGTVILRLAPGARFERLAAGFAWER